MAIPVFTDFGLLPAGVHDCSLPEAENFLCSNEHRTRIWAGLNGFLDWIQPLPLPAAILIDGSYVTDKSLPSDVDVVIDVTGCNSAEWLQWATAWNEHHGMVKDTFHVDFYPFLIGLGNDFSVFFQYVRIDDALRRGVPPETRKGILRVIQ